MIIRVQVSIFDVDIRFSPHPSEWVLRGVTLDELERSMTARLKGLDERKVKVGHVDGEVAPAGVLTERDLGVILADVLRREIQAGHVVADGVEVVINEPYAGPSRPVTVEIVESDDEQPVNVSG